MSRAPLQFKEDLIGLRGLWRQLTQGLDRPLLMMLGVLFLLSLVAIFSASHDEPSRLLAHVRNLALAALIALTLAQFGAGQFQKIAVPLYTLGVVLLFAVEVAGDTAKGATRWLDLGVARIQPSELLKIALPMMLAWIIHRAEGRFSAKVWLGIGAAVLVPIALILKQPDLGTAILVAAAGFYVLAVSGLPPRLMLAGLVLGLIPILGLLISGDAACGDDVHWPGFHDYQRQRVCTLLDPTRDPLGKGFHIIQSTIAVGSGGVFGKGLLQGTQTQLAFIPERETDFIFSGFAEEFGFLGAAVLISVYVALTLRGLWIAVGAPTIFGRLLAASLSLTIFTYTFVNLGMVTGILPVVGVPLPFVSYGGSAMVTLGVGLGILLSVARDRSRVTQGFSLQR